ncbi:MAG: preprotein translocase subunit SecG, partial [Acidobacteria bacterium]|nr:preprotein translocase subunit SecG [Acidobacteriota bacterium]
MIFYYVLTALYALVCLVLLAVILLQQGKGGDIAAAFGGGSSQTAFGARSGATVLSRATAVFAVLFMLGAIALSIMGQAGPRSLLSGTPAPPPASAPATAVPASSATPADSATTATAPAAPAAAPTG